jgi:DNA-directed RNA polymerase II subunit RPB2
MDNSSVWKIIDKYFEDNPQSLVRHHIESYNDFFKNGIFQIFKEKNPIKIQTRYDESIDDYRSQCIMHFGGKDGTKLYFGKPIIYDENDSHYMYPNEARLRNMTYGMTIHYDIEIEFIDILGDGEMPTVVDESGELTYGGSADSPEFTNFKMNGGNDPEDPKDEESAEEPEIVGGAPPVRKQKKRVASELTAAQTALLREATEKSMVNPNTQKRTTVLEKVYLGKFPIMVQSDFCVLAGLPREVRHTMGECLNDVGGYFIIDGKEKTVITQEKFGDNMLYIKESTDDKYLYSAEIRSVSENVAKPIRTLSVKIMAPTSTYTFKNIVVNIPNIRKPVPLFIVFRALGIISDKQIVTMCLLDLDKHEQIVDLFAPSVHDAGSILTQRNALKYMATLTKGKTVSHVLEILADYFFPHIGEMNFIQKAYYLGYVVLRLLNVYMGIDQPTDRDNYKFKRLELVGSLMNDLFREYYTIQQRLIHLGFEEKITYNRAIYENDLKGLIKTNFKTVFAERTVEVGFKKAFKGNWGSQEHTKRVGIVQDLNRLSHNSMMSHLRKTNLPLDASVKLVGPRSLHSTQWGFFDPIDTPDGGNIGIHKHMSISAYVSQGVSREPMIRWLREKEEMKLIEDCSPLELSRLTKVIINGLWAGAISEPAKTVEKIRLFRRNGLIPIYTSATFDIKQNTVFIYTDAGRICRPIFYRDQETGKMSFESELVKTLIGEGDFTWNQLITGFNPKKIPGFHPNNYGMYELSELYEGITEESNPAKIQKFLEYKAIIDYIDTNETENALIALNDEILATEKQKKFTHMEIHESFIFGMMCNLINFPENNPATRNSFSCGQSKQACSMYHTNHQVRMDKTAVVLVSGQTPLVKTRYLEHINHEENPYGENAIVAIMCYTGYNVEDAVLINEGALKRGLFRTTYYSTYEAHEEKSKTGEVTVNKLFTNIEIEASVTGTKPGYDYSKLDKYGIIQENTQVDDKTVLIGLTASTASSPEAKTDMSKTPKKGQLGIVDKSFITEGEEGNRIAKIRIREERIPNIGDKMASRSGQKGTIGLVVPECDMPFTKDGIRPDIIINPHAIPSRMTIGHLVECIVGKAAAIYGGFADSTAFNNKGSKIKVFGEVLSKVGFHSSGNEILYNGMTGEQIETEIFFGPNYYMRLKHMVKDKINYRALGPRTALTKQPVGGRANDGGLRIGEMERDSVISHGAAEFLRESMMERGDKYRLAICNTTGLVAIYNPAKNIFMSPMADGPLQFFTSLDGKETHIENITKFGRSFSIVNVPYSLKLLIQELQTINIQLRLITEENIKQMENMSYSKNIGKLLFKEDITPTEITQMIKKELDSLRGKPDVYSTPESIVFKTPSPEYATGSPAYQPGEEEMDANSPAYNPLANTPSPIYNPLANTPSPPYDPNSPAYNPNSPVYNPNSPAYEPHSPEEPPPMGGGDGPIRFKPNIENDVLSEQAAQYSKGELVHYRGDSIPTRLWAISDVGDRLLTIDAEDDNGLEPMDKTKIVTAADIYRQGQYTNSLPFEEPILSVPGLYNSFDQANYPTMAMRQPITQGMPSGIIFAPQIKVVNGSDFSTEPTTNSDTQLANVANDISSIVNSPSGSTASPSASPSGSAMPLPDGPLIVKKL